MPVWLRQLTFNLLKEHFDKQNEEMEAQNKMLNKNNKKSDSGLISVPDYKTSRAAKK